MNYYPVFLNLEGRRVLVVGHGRVADAKAQSLLEAGAKVRRVSGRRFQKRDLAGVNLVICATSNERLNRRASALATARRLFVNVVDRPELCSFIAPAVVRKGHVQIAISTGGHSPALAVKLKEEIAKTIVDAYGELLDLLAGLRPRVLARIPNPAARAKIFQNIVRGRALELLRHGRRLAARRLIERTAFRSR